jgi:hypothetical protein
MNSLTDDEKRVVVVRFRALYDAIYGTGPDLPARFAEFQGVYRGGVADFVAAFNNTKSPEDRSRWVWLLRRYLADEIGPAYWSTTQSGSYRFAK